MADNDASYREQTYSWIELKTVAKMSELGSISEVVSCAYPFNTERKEKKVTHVL